MMKRTLTASSHAVSRFKERGGSAVMRRIGHLHTPEAEEMRLKGGDHSASVLVTAVTLSVMQGYGEEVFDKSAGCTSALVPFVLKLNAERKVSLVALVRDLNIVTVLDPEMVAQNKSSGAYSRPDGTPFPLTAKLPGLAQLETPVGFIDTDEVYSWAKDFFLKNERASVKGAMKVANNQKPRVPPMHDVFSRARQDALAELSKREEALQAAKEAKEKAEAARLVAEMRKPRAPVPLPVPIVIPEQREPFHAGFHAQVERKPSVMLVPHGAAPPAAVTWSKPGTTVTFPAAPSTAAPSPEVPMVDVAAQSLPQTEEAQLRGAAKNLLATLRQLGIQSCILTVVDGPEGPSAEWEVEYKRKGTGKAAL